MYFLQKPTQTVWKIEPKPKSEPVNFHKSKTQPNLYGKFNPNPNPNLWIFSDPKTDPTCLEVWTQTQTQIHELSQIQTPTRPA